MSNLTTGLEKWRVQREGNIISRETPPTFPSFREEVIDSALGTILEEFIEKSRGREPQFT